jgi:hypothetical protein
MNKKGEISSTAIILIIFLVVGIGVSLLFIYRANFSEITDETVCSNSVIQRSTILGLSKDTVAPSLNCKTGYYCISKDGTCEIMSSSTEIIKVETSDDVYKEIANKMVSCWRMFGEGKLDYAGERVDKYFYCSNCYQIGFDNSLNMFANEEIQERELYRYLSSYNVSGTDSTYLEYLIGVNAEAMEGNVYKADANFKTFKLGKQYFITTGIYSNIAAWKTGVLGAAVAGGTFVAVAGISAVVSFFTGGLAVPGILLIIGGTAATVTGGAAGYFAGVIVQGDSGQQFYSPKLIEANSEEYASLKCSSINTLA